MRIAIPHAPARRASGAALLALALLTTGCGSGSDTATEAPDSAAPTTSAPAASPTTDPSDTATATESAPPSTTPAGSAFDGVTIRARVRDGKVSPATHRVKIEKDQRVRLTVTSDVADEIHVHGFDKSKDLEPGEPGTVTFKANQQGVFEVELEDAGLQLVQLEVR